MGLPGDDEPTEVIGPAPAAPERTEVMPAVDAWTPVPPPAPRRAATPPDHPPRYGWGTAPGPDAPQPGAGGGRPAFAPPPAPQQGAWGVPPDAAPDWRPSSSGWAPPQPGWGPPQPGWAPSPPGWGPPQQGWGPPQPGWAPPQQGWAPPQQGWAPPQQGWPDQRLPSGGWAPARPSREELTWAPAAHWLPLLTHWVGPLVVLLTAGRRSERVRAEAVASLNWEITVAILLAVATALGPFGLVAPGLALVTLAVSAGLHVYGAITVARGGRFRYPGALPFIS